MKATRRQAVLGALAVPAVASAGKLRAASGSVTVYDPALTSAPALDAKPIMGDRIRFARALFDCRPALVVGVTRHADALLIADVGFEAGYRPVNPPADFGQLVWALAPQGRR